MSTTNKTKHASRLDRVRQGPRWDVPRAAWFSAGDAAVAKWIARHYGLSILKATQSY